MIVSQGKLDAPAVDEGRAAAAQSQAEIARRGIHKRWSAIVANEQGARSGDDIEALHAMRVASRRLREALRVFEAYLPARSARRVGKRLRRLTRALGAPREWDVHAQLLASIHAATDRPADRAAIEHVWEFVEDRRTRERERMLKRLDGWDCAGLGRKIGRLVAKLHPRHEAGDAPPQAAWAALAPLVDSAFANLATLRAGERPEDLHAMRISVKRLRYAVELLKAAFVSDHRTLVNDLAALQETLGSYRDHMLLEELVSRRLSRLSERGRRTLVEGLIGPVDTLVAKRHAEYTAFVRKTGGLSAAAVGRRIRTALGLPEAAAAEEGGSEQPGR